MKTRVNIQTAGPKAYQSMLALESAIRQSPLERSHLHLVKIRASQLNGCAFCINMHTEEAMKDGETAQRIFLLNAWREANMFSPEEKAILALTEAITYISKEGVPDSIYEDVSAHFDETYVAALIMTAITINAWNRIAISTQLEIA